MCMPTMQIRNPAGCGASKISNELHLVDEYAFPLTEFVGWSAHDTAHGFLICTAKILSHWEDHAGLGLR